MIEELADKPDRVENCKYKKPVALHSYTAVLAVMYGTICTT